MLRHSATRSLFERRDVIGGLDQLHLRPGIPGEYLKAAVKFEVGETLNIRSQLRELVNNVGRNDTEIARGRFRMKGDVLEIGPAYEDRLVRIELFGDEVEAIRYVDPTTGEILQSMDAVNIYPAKHFVTPKDRLDSAISAIRSELGSGWMCSTAKASCWRAQRLEQRTKYDLEMLGQVGYCNGVENYARHLAGREGGTPPECLIDGFPDDWLLIVDESHVTCSQLQAMYNGDQARKKVLIEHGFRLPSAADNRPLKEAEFWEGTPDGIRLSHPGRWEMEVSSGEVAEQVIRPTGVLDPVVEVRPTTGQVDDLLGEIDRAAKNQRCSLPLSPSEWRKTSPIIWRRTRCGCAICTQRSTRSSGSRSSRPAPRRIRRAGGGEPAGEGLDLPESVLDARKASCGRSDSIQTIGRAARHVEGVALLYADNMTDSMAKAISETERRRAIQQTYNEKHGVVPGRRARRPVTPSLASWS